MKILELQLRAFGPFTYVNLDFADGEPRLHIIYGLNEAGKSSALRGLTALLYGIEHHSPDNFRHDYQQLRIGGRLRHADGREITFLRRKGRSKTLLNPDGDPLDDATLGGFLHGVSKQLFLTLFGIDHAVLVQGGRDILKGEGEVGQSLFAAGLGTARVRGFLDELDRDMRALFLPRGQVPTINQAITKYHNAKRLISEVSLSSREFARHERALKNAQVQLEKISRRLQRLDREKNRLSRLQTAIPNIGRRKAILVHLAELGEVVILPSDFSQNRQKWVHNLEAAQENLQRANEAKKGLEKKVQELTLPETLLDKAESVIELYKRLGAHRKAFQDLPRLEEKRDQLLINAKALLSEVRPDLTLEHAGEVRLNVAQRTRIQKLGGQHQALVDSLERAKQDVKKAESQLVKAQGQMESLASLRDPSELRRVVERVRKQGNLEEEHNSLLDELHVAEQQAQVDLQKLGLWAGTIEDLEKLALPASETIDRFESEGYHLEAELAMLAGRIDDKLGSLGEIDRQLEELRLAGAVPSEAELVTARERRDYGWTLIRREWLDKEEVTEEKKDFDAEHDLPEAYEKRVAHADQLADRLRREADRVAEQAKLLSDRTRHDEALKKLEEQKTIVLDQTGELQEEWQAIWTPTGITPLPPKEMRSWVVRQNDLVRQAENLRRRRRELDRLQGQIEANQSELGQALEKLEEPGPATGENLEALVDRSQAVLDSNEELARERNGLEKRIEELQNSLSQARQEMTAASGKLRDWQGQWLTALKSLSLSGEASPAEAYAVLEKLGELFKKLDEATSLQGRIDGISKDAENFSAEVKALTEHVAPDLAELAVEQAAAELQARLTKAQKDSATLTSLKEQIDTRHNEIREAQVTIQLMKERLAAMCKQAGCAEYVELEAVEARFANYQRLQQDLQTLETQLLEQSAGATLEALIQEAETVNADHLPQQISEISGQISELEEERDRLRETIWEERGLLADMDGDAEAALKAEEAQGILAEIRDQVDQYVRLRMAHEILRREIERYRAENQGPILRRASELFTYLTVGSFAKLQIDFTEKDEPILVGIRPSDEHIYVEGMSDGTRDQLYLALRLASLERYLEANEPMPFVVDDILIKFDDERAEATLKVLAQLATQTQVIFFTHHFHLVELAKKVGNASMIKLHRLGV